MKIIVYILIFLMSAFAYAMQPVMPPFVEGGLQEDIIELSDISQLNDPGFVWSLQQADAAQLQLYFDTFIKTLKNDIIQIIDDSTAVTAEARKELPQNISSLDRFRLIREKIKTDYLNDAKSIRSRVNSVNEYIFKLQRILYWIESHRQTEVKAEIIHNLNNQLKNLHAQLKGPTDFIVTAIRSVQD